MAQWIRRRSTEPKILGSIPSRVKRFWQASNRPPRGLSRGGPVARGHPAGRGHPSALTPRPRRPWAHALCLWRLPTARGLSPHQQGSCLSVMLPPPLLPTRLGWGAAGWGRRQQGRQGRRSAGAGGPGRRRQQRRTGPRRRAGSSPARRWLRARAALRGQRCVGGGGGRGVPGARARQRVVEQLQSLTQLQRPPLGCLRPAP
jgi:hypothetical protein